MNKSEDERNKRHFGNNSLTIRSSEPPRISTSFWFPFKGATDARRYWVEPAWCAKSFDVPFYRGLIDKAWGEISYAFPPKICP